MHICFFCSSIFSWPLLTGPRVPHVHETGKMKISHESCKNDDIRTGLSSCIPVSEVAFVFDFHGHQRRFWWNVWTKSDDDFFMARTSGAGSIYMNPFINPDALAMAGVFTVYSWKVHGRVPTFLGFILTLYQATFWYLCTIYLDLKVHENSQKQCSFVGKTGAMNRATYPRLPLLISAFL